MAQLVTVRLARGDAPSWGFRLQGGKDFGTPLVVQKVNLGSPAERAGLSAGDSVIKINNTDVFNLRHKDAQDVVVRAGSAFEMTVQRGGSTWKPTVTPVGSHVKPQSLGNNISPVTKTSLAASKRDNFGAIGTGHNVAAKPFGGAQVNGSLNGGGPKLVNKQYNSPVGLYSEESIAETLSAQAEVLSPGVLGVNFKKNEKNYDATNSEVFRMVQEADKEPKQPEPVTRSEFYATHSHAVGGRSAATPRSATPVSDHGRPQHHEPQSINSEGATKCSDCERVIVGVFVKIKDKKNLHVECFKCATCGTSLNHVGYYDINNKLYCDVHAVLVAKSSSPGIIPIAGPPSGRNPGSTISSALSNHPSPGPLSPGSNSIAPPFQQNSEPSLLITDLVRNVSFAAAKKEDEAQPYQEITACVNNNNNSLQSLTHNKFSNSTPLPYSKYVTQAGGNFSAPRPFSSVSGPLSPKAGPLSPKAYTPAPSFTSPAPPTYSSPSAEGRSVQNIVWPPPHEEPELPTASPLYFPPPSQIQIHKRVPDVAEESDLENPPMEPQPKLSLSSSEITDINFQKSTFECRETITDTLGTQILVESILQNRPKSPPPVNEKGVPPLQKLATDIETCCLKTCSESKECKKACTTEQTLTKVENSVPHKWESPLLTALKTAPADSFAQIPTKRSMSALAAALAVAPSEPFTPIGPASFTPVPLPEETEPYFPPEHPLEPIEPLEPSKPKELHSDTPFAKALQIAPERPYTPVEQPKPVRRKKQPEDELLKDLPKPQGRLTMRDALTVASERPYTPLSVDSDREFEEVRSEVSVEVCTKKERPPVSDELKALEATVVVQEVDVKKEETQTSAQETFVKDAVVKQQEDTVYKKPLPVASLLHRPDNLPQYQVNLSENVEMELLMMEKQALVQKCSKTRTETAPKPPQPEAPQLERLAQPPSSVIQQPPTNPSTTFAPVIESRPGSSASPRPLTPSMINKPPPTLPYYQANLVAQQHLAPETNLLDPRSPQISRSPSPCTERRSATPCRATPVERAKSPAPGPPPNPLKSHEPLPTPQDARNEEARKMVTHFLPQYKEKMELMERAHVSEQNYQHDSLHAEKFEGSSVQQQQVVVVPQGDGVVTTKITAQADSRHLEQLDQSQTKTVEKSSDGLCQIERKRTVTEEFERTQKETFVQIEKNVSSATHKYPFRDVNNPVLDQHGIVGLHVTNPQPLVSPFLSGPKSQPPGQTQTKPSPPQVPPQIPLTIQVQPTTSSTPPNIQVPPTPKVIVPSCAPPTNVPKLPPSSSQSVTPNVPLPNAGVGGGRQAGAVGVAPKRGRGVLSTAQLGGGSRVPLCGQCHSYIRGPFITALGKIWCPEHFICATPSCRRPLQDLGFVEEHGQLYCEYCFEQYLAPPCSKCGSKVKGDCLKAIGKMFHPECFNCSHCGKLFGNSPFFLEDGLPYCEADWNEMFTTKCFACGFPVEAGDRWVEALSNNYHSQCFNCTMCKKNLEGQSFFAKGGRPFCKNHAR